MRQCMDAPNLHRRLNKIIGQLNAINRMIDEDIPCEEILSQINAAKAAMRKKPSRASPWRWSASPTCVNGGPEGFPPGFFFAPTQHPGNYFPTQKAGAIELRPFGCRVLRAAALFYFSSGFSE